MLNILKTLTAGLGIFSATALWIILRMRGMIITYKKRSAENLQQTMERTNCSELEMTMPSSVVTIERINNNYMLTLETDAEEFSVVAPTLYEAIDKMDLELGVDPFED